MRDAISSIGRYEIVIVVQRGHCMKQDLWRQKTFIPYNCMHQQQTVREIVFYLVEVAGSLMERGRDFGRVRVGFQHFVLKEV